MTWHAVKWRPTLEKILGEVSCTECTDQENDFELIPMVKMGTRHPIDGYFGNEFPSICNHCGVMVAEVGKKCLLFAFFCKNNPLRGNFQNPVPKRIQRLTVICVVLCANVVKFGRLEIGIIVRYLPDKKKTKFRLASPLSLLHGLPLKSVRASHPPDNILRVPSFGSISAEL